MITQKSKREIDLMRRAGAIVALVLAKMQELAHSGTTTAELDQAAREIITKAGAIPSFLGFPCAHGGIDFPGVICASVNDEVIHGIPGTRELKEGDILSVDVGVILNGWHADAARTYPVGNISEEAARLIAVTEMSFEAGMAAAVPGNRVRDISEAVQKVVTNNGFTVVRDFVGHGIGVEMHEEPQIPNYTTKAWGSRLAEGMTLAIEPMVNAGGWQVIVKSDRWTVVTADGKYSSHHENTVAVSEGGPVVLTAMV